MKNIEKWLNENGIQYKKPKYGNPYYFNDGFQVDGLQIAFYFDSIGNDREKRRALEKFMSRKRAYVCQPRRFGAGYTYTIMTVFDATRLEAHEKAVSESVEKIWEEEHARRLIAAQAL